MLFADKIAAGWTASGSCLCVGLDPLPDRMPQRFSSDARPVLAFNRHVVDMVGDLACAFKPQFAHHGALGAEDDLARSIAYVRERAPHALVILDAKRGDIGSTAERYAIEAFDRYDADAVTVNPYLGDEGIWPFLDRPDRGAVILCRTSNAGADRVQHAVADGKPLFLAIAERAERVWNRLGNAMLVVGATDAVDLARVRAAAPTLTFLVPGVGEQGGDPVAVSRAGRRDDGSGLVVSASRSILYAGDDAAMRSEAEALHRSLKTPVPQFA